ncbi:MAG: hypothetical protein CMP08_09095 [Xanthomonadales bacterium]|nr:hypothetical protein [Xanthomonadales bacterium]
MNDAWAALRLYGDGRSEPEDQVDHDRPRDPVAAPRFVALVDRVLSNGVGFPDAPRPARLVPAWHLSGFPVTTVYLVDDTDRVVVAAAHQKRSPTYWVSRLGPG